MGLISDAILKADYLTIVKKLNDLLSLDAEFTKNIIGTRFEVNSSYANSDNFVCLEESGKCTAGLIGVLNGLLDRPDLYRIAAEYNDDSELVRFALLQFNNGKLVEVK